MARAVQEDLHLSRAAASSQTDFEVGTSAVLLMQLVHCFSLFISHRVAGSLITHQHQTTAQPETVFTCQWTMPAIVASPT